MQRLIMWGLLALVLTMAPAATTLAQDHGLHNSSKRFTDPAVMNGTDWSDPAEMERSWRAAIVRVPRGGGRSVRSSVDRLPDLLADADTKYPTVIYLHGCSGIWPGTHRRIRFLADNGFLVIAPASFARKKYPLSCDTQRHRGGLYRGTLRMRQYDAGYAIEKARALAFVDTDNIVLMGLSQGGITTATFEARNQLQRVSARVVEGWTCRAGWAEYAGVNAPANEPVLTLVGVRDPWFQNPWTKGDCTSLLNKANGSRSVVYKTGALAAKHELLDFAQPRREVLEFLRAHVELPLSVRDVQQVLKAQGLDPGPVDGAWGAKTLNALNQLRARHGLEPVRELEATSLELLKSLKQ